jgi:hypothetical protein
VSEERDKPAFDEQPLTKLLEAAFVLQEHNSGRKAVEQIAESQDPPLKQAPSVPAPASGKPEPTSSPAADKDLHTPTLAEIVETQRQIQVRHLELDSAIALIAERAAEIARAGGAAIGLLEGNSVRYRAAAGEMNLPVGSKIPLEKALSRDCLQAGQVVRCQDANSESLPDVEDCRRRGIQAMLAVPVYHDGGIAGAIELYYAGQHPFTEQDLHTCQLMAGLVTGVLARNEERGWKKSLASERAVMLEALEKLKPRLAALVDAPAANGRESKADVAATAPATTPCLKCGHELVADEHFCGRCGSPRSGDYEAPTMQSKVASLWHMQQALAKKAVTPLGNGTAAPSGPHLDESRSEKPLADWLEQEMPELFAAPALQAEKAPPPPELTKQEVEAGLRETPEPPVIPAPETSQESENEDDSASAPMPAKPAPSSEWSSAATARAFLERLAAARPPGALTRFWNARRGDFYLALAVILVAGVIRWGIWSNHSLSAAGGPAAAAASHRKPAPNADLSLFDRMLVSLGLAEAPEPPEYKGNPETQVWVDLHTALYYCPGADLYGKTPKGKFTTQRDAQLDQFEPAYRKACD